MKLNFEKMLEVIFPLSEDEKRISLCDLRTFASKMDVRQRNGIEGLASFKDAQVRGAIHLLKFHNHPKAALLLQELLKQRLKTLPVAGHLLLPIPLSAQRRRERGYNQVEIIAQGALKGFLNIELAADILIRTRNTRPQTTLSKKEREANLSGVFSLNKRKASFLEGKNVIVLDDVTTTGSTLKEALAVVEQGKPSSVLCIALAY